MSILADSPDPNEKMYRPSDQVGRPVGKQPQAYGWTINITVALQAPGGDYTPQ